jgi:hypothetical protein
MRLGMSIHTAWVGRMKSLLRSAASLRLRNMIVAQHPPFHPLPHTLTTSHNEQRDPN